jgi:hypothetical protein
MLDKGDPIPEPGPLSRCVRDRQPVPGFSGLVFLRCPEDPIKKSAFCEPTESALISTVGGYGIITLQNIRCELFAN